MATISVTARAFAFVALAFTAAGFAYAAPVTPEDALPTTLLTCGGSIITDIGPRLEGDTDNSSGTSVFFKNRGSQVSYDKVPAILRSKKGDHVLICLVFVPKHCPAGVFETSRDAPGTPVRGWDRRPALGADLARQPG